MSDQHPSQPKPPKRPANRPPASVESKFIGYLVLGFGILAVVAVLMIAFMGRGPEMDAPQPEMKKAEAISAKSNTLIQAPKVIPPKPEYTLPFKRQPSFDRTLLNGNWQAMIGMYTAVLQMNEGVYQIILAGDDPYMPRHYSSGAYRTIEDIIIFEPQLDWPKPITKSGTGNYQTITVSPFNIMTAEQQGKLLWANIPPEEERVTRIYEPPLFLGEDIEYVVWTRIE
jgi:hypothetical protein